MMQLSGSISGGSSNRSSLCRTPTSETTQKCFGDQQTQRELRVLNKEIEDLRMKLSKAIVTIDCLHQHSGRLMCHLQRTLARLHEAESQVLDGTCLCRHCDKSGESALKVEEHMDIDDSFDRGRDETGA